MELPHNHRFMLLLESILDMWAILVFLMSFLLQAHQATYLAKQVESDLKELDDGGCRKSLSYLKLDAVWCRKKAKSASKRNRVIGINATLWTVYIAVAYSLIPFTREKAD